jgi:hypothetical protein
MPSAPFSGAVKFPLDVPGIYTYTIDANWNGYPAFMPGLPPTGGEIYVLEAQPPPNATGIQITTPTERRSTRWPGLTSSARAPPTRCTTRW